MQATSILTKIDIQSNTGNVPVSLLPYWDGKLVSRKVNYYYEMSTFTRIAIRIFRDRVIEFPELNCSVQQASVIIEGSGPGNVRKMKIGMHLFPILRFNKTQILPEMSIYLKDRNKIKLPVELPEIMSKNLLRYLNEGKPYLEFNGMAFVNYLCGIHDNSHRGLARYHLSPCDRKELQSGDIVVFQTESSLAASVAVYLRDNLFLWHSGSTSLRVSSYEDIVKHFSATSVMTARKKEIVDDESETSITEEFIAEHRLDKLEFAESLTKRLYESILSGDHHEVSELINSHSSDEKFRAFTDREPRRGLNILGCAAFLGKASHVKLFLKIPREILTAALEQEDNNRWTPLHHIALLPDKGKLYKRCKAITGINSKAHTRYYCESASMLRQMLKSETRFDREMKIYFRDGPPGQRVESQLTWEDFKIKYSRYFCIPPRYFRHIPFADRVFFQRLWISDDFTHLEPEDERRAVVDNYIRTIEQYKGDKGLALTRTLYDDEGNLLPNGKELGLGVESRQTYVKNQIVALWGGRLVKDADRASGDRIYTQKMFGKYFLEGIEYRSFGTNVQDGFSNITQMYIGTSLAPLLVHKAKDEILPDTSVCYYYQSPGFIESGENYLTEIRPSAKKQSEMLVI